jgi:hypothetical protein
MATGSDATSKANSVGTTMMSTGQCHHSARQLGAKLAKETPFDA